MAPGPEALASFGNLLELHTPQYDKQSTLISSAEIDDSQDLHEIVSFKIHLRLTLSHFLFLLLKIKSSFLSIAFIILNCGSGNEASPQEGPTRFFKVCLL